MISVEVALEGATNWIVPSAAITPTAPFWFQRRPLASRFKVRLEPTERTTSVPMRDHDCKCTAMAPLWEVSIRFETQMGEMEMAHTCGYQ